MWYLLLAFGMSGRTVVGAAALFMPLHETRNIEMPETKGSGAPELPVIFSFWYGPMTYFERLCIASFLEQGHPFHLYSYEEYEDLPAGCEWRNAADVLPQDRVFLYKGTRTPSGFANLFRLELLRRKAGIWVDCDVYCVRPFADLGEYVFGYPDPPSWRHGWRQTVNNAVLLMPPDSALLKALLAVFESDDAPPGISVWQRIWIGMRRALGIEVPLSHMRLGSTGPAPLTYYVRKLGLERYASPYTVFSPIRATQAPELLTAGSSIDQYISADTLGVHLWHSAFTNRGRQPVPLPEPGSFLAREAERLGVTWRSVD